MVAYLLVPHVLVPHLLWVVLSLWGAAASGRLLAATLEDDESRREPLWLSAAAFAVWCWVSAFALWWTL
jgi:hypothetical protein